MNDKIKNKAVELADEEMDKVAGGKAAHIISRPNANEFTVECCDLVNQTVDGFVINCLEQKRVCGSFSRKPESTGSNSCSVCCYYKPVTISTSSMSPNEARDQYRSQGYSVIVDEIY